MKGDNKNMNPMIKDYIDSISKEDAEKQFNNLITEIKQGLLKVADYSEEIVYLLNKAY